jgi:hypothetical protein
MSDPGEQYTFDQLPQKVREDFERMKVRLGSALTIGNPRRVNGGWIVGILYPRRPVRQLPTGRRRRLRSGLKAGAPIVPAPRRVALTPGDQRDEPRSQRWLRGSSGESA